MDFAVTSEAKYYKKIRKMIKLKDPYSTNADTFYWNFFLAIERPLNIKNSEGLKKNHDGKNETSHATYHDSSKTSDNLFEAPSVWSVDRKDSSAAGAGPQLGGDRVLLRPGQPPQRLQAVKVLQGVKLEALCSGKAGLR